MQEKHALYSKVNNVTNKTVEERKRKNSDSMTAENPAKQGRCNYYEPLSNSDDECDKEILHSFEKHVREFKEKIIYPTSSKRDQNKQDQNKPAQIAYSAKASVNTAPNNNKKIPPINICDIETKELISFLKNGLKINEFKIREFRYKKSLFVNSMSDYQKVRNYLEKTKAKFFTYTPKIVKNKTFLLKGLEADTSMEEIQNDLSTHECDNLKFLKISQFSTNKSVKEGYKLPIFMIQISPESDVNLLKQIKVLLYRVVEWEMLRRPDITQCRNCQGFFHSASNCFLPTKCVKCNNSHEKGKCELNEVRKEELYCVLCKKFGHPASYKGCEVYKKLQDNLRKKKQILMENKNKKQMYYNSYVNQGTSFSNVIRNNNIEPNSNVNTSNTLLHEIKNIMTNLTAQLVNLQQQLQIQTSRIDTLFNMIDV